MNLFSTQFSFEHMSFEIYLSGCKLHPCKGCFNQETWDEDAGVILDKNKYTFLENKITEKINLIENFWVLGGEPLEKPENELIVLFNFLKRFNKPIWLFTRYQLKDISPNILKYFDYIKTGRYEQTHTKDTKTNFRIELGSSNQNIYKYAYTKWYKEKSYISLKNKIDKLINKKYGLLTIKGFGEFKNNILNVECKCDCGNTKNINAYHLLNGNIISCGCYALERLKKYNTKTKSYKDRTIPAKNAVYGKYTSRCKERGTKFELTKEEFREIISQNCYYCGIEPSNISTSKNTINTSVCTYNGLDRVDNKYGYIHGNIVPCCTKCNTRKNANSLEELKNFVKRMEEFYDKNGKKNK